MSIDEKHILEEVANYYSDKIQTYGQTPQGVDWNGHDSQHLRFDQLLKIVPVSMEAPSLTDIGCGYGAFLGYLREHFPRASYLGVDISPHMIKEANARFRTVEGCRFLHAAEPDQTSDFAIASGIFNVRQSFSDEAWQIYIETTLDMMNARNTRGFAFNCLTSYSDAEKMRDYLFYADPSWMLDLCIRKYSKNVALLHDYGLYEFTILVRK
ncbi:class I SAM-dependent methyltransferase [Roseobacter sp. S98]|uniref:class I SAM-dependent methyltransferase n=1 Tax=Roseobacter algicola (ex Choi et al. 2025) (nom. illeg.) TaxID=3092138 RepID=UPI0035C7531D